MNRQETDDVAELKTIYAFEEKYIQGDTCAKYLRLVNSMKPIPTIYPKSLEDSPALQPSILKARKPPTQVNYKS